MSGAVGTVSSLKALPLFFKIDLFAKQGHTEIYNLTFIHLSQVPKSRPSRDPVPGKFSLSLHSHQRGGGFTVSQAVFPFQFLAK